MKMNHYCMLTTIFKMKKKRKCLNKNYKKKSIDNFLLNLYFQDFQYLQMKSSCKLKQTETIYHQTKTTLNFQFLTFTLIISFVIFPFIIWIFFEYNSQISSSSYYQKIARSSPFKTSGKK